MITRNNLMRTLFIFSNYGGDGAKVAHGECLIVFYLFYNRAASTRILSKLLPTRDARSIRRYVDNLNEKGYITIIQDKETKQKILEITDKGTDFCMRWLARSEECLT